MAEIIRYVNPGSTPGGDGTTPALTGINRAFSSAQEAEAALDNAYDGDYVKVYCATTGSANDGATVQFNGATFVDPSVDYIEFIGDCDGPTWDDSKYHLVTTDVIAVNIYDNAIRLTNLQISTVSPTANSRHCINIVSIDASNDIRISKCKLKQHGNINYLACGINCADSEMIIRVWNNLIYNGSYYAHTYNCGISLTSASLAYLYYNTIVDYYRGLYNQSSTTLCKNNNFSSAASANIVNSGTLTGSDYNMSDDTTDTGGDNDETEVTFTFEGGDDYRLALGDTGAQNKGTDLSGDGYLPVSDDLLGNARDGSTPDCGCFEIQDAGIYAGMTESITISDISEAVSNAITSISENLEVSEAVSSSATRPVSTSEAMEPSDTEYAAVNTPAYIIEACDAADTCDATTSNESQTYESAAIADSQSAVASFAPLCNESVTPIDYPSATAIISNTYGESVAAADTCSCTKSTDASASEAASVTDSTSAVSQLTASTTENCGAIDLSDAVINSNIYEATESINVTDNLSATVIKFAAIVERVDIADEIITAGLLDFETIVQNAMFDFIQPVIGLWLEGRDVDEMPRIDGQPIMVWSKGNAPRPETPVLMGDVRSIVKIGRDVVSEPDHFGNCIIRGTREFMLYLQYFGDSAFGQIKKIMEACEDPERLSVLYDAGITTVDTSEPVSIRDYVGTMAEDRASLDIRFRTTTSWTTNSGMPIENVQADGVLVTGNIQDTVNIDIATQ